MRKHEFQTFFYGDKLNPLLTACLNSFIEKGHTVKLFVYSEVPAPNGINIEDASKILPEEDLFFFESSPAAFADIFRYKLLLMYGGWWIDTDIYCLSDVIPNSEYCWAKEDRTAINNAILKFPKADPLCEKLYNESIKRAKNISTWGELGPKLLTELFSGILVNSLYDSSLSFYPVHWLETHFFWLPDCKDRVLERIKGSTFLHMWNSIYKRMGINLEVAPPVGSFLNEIILKDVCNGGINQTEYGNTLKLISEYLNNDWIFKFWEKDLNREIISLWPKSIKRLKKL
jgi:mannosyltransferase OCH1-like enzyme